MGRVEARMKSCGIKPPRRRPARPQAASSDVRRVTPHASNCGDWSGSVCVDRIEAGRIPDTVGGGGGVGMKGNNRSDSSSWLTTAGLYEALR